MRPTREVPEALRAAKGCMVGLLIMVPVWLALGGTLALLVYRIVAREGR